MNRSLVASVIASSICLAGCARTQYMAGPSSDPNNFGRDSGRCSVEAASTEQGISVSGSRKEVIGAIAVNAIANGIRNQIVFDACMQASGWIPANGNQRAQLVSTTQGKVSSAPQPSTSVIPVADSADSPTTPLTSPSVGTTLPYHKTIVCTPQTC